MNAEMYQVGRRNYERAEADRDDAAGRARQAPNAASRRVAERDQAEAERRMERARAWMERYAAR
jgi:hypothetical protein